MDQQWHSIKQDHSNSVYCNEMTMTVRTSCTVGVYHGAGHVWIPHASASCKGKWSRPRKTLYTLHMGGGSCSKQGKCTSYWPRDVRRVYSRSSKLAWTVQTKIERQPLQFIKNSLNKMQKISRLQFNILLQIHTNIPNNTASHWSWSQTSPRPSASDPTLPTPCWIHFQHDKSETRSIHLSVQCLTRCNRPSQAAMLVSPNPSYHLHIRYLW